uniref:C2 domain-containing protein n=1 Tax=Serinus canaria TaxID=9135 RepID=A0A8C9L0E5_SERCA
RGTRAGDRAGVRVSLVSVKPKAQSRPARMNCYVEVAGDGLPSETKKTGKQMGVSELLWNEILTLNVTAQSHLELKVWICHTLRNELLGAASVSLGSLLKGGGKRMCRAQGRAWNRARSRAGPGAGQGTGPWCPWWLRSPAGNKVPLCARGQACGQPYLRQRGRRGGPGNTSPSAICCRLRLPERGS